MLELILRATGAGLDLFAEFDPAPKGQVLFCGTNDAA